MTTSNCPNCGAEPTEESQVYAQMKDLGYLHEDRKYECPECGEKWIVGEPQGESENTDWVCDSCGGDYIPHFLEVNLNERTFRVRPKCKDCFYVPDERIDICNKFLGPNVKGFIGHHYVTGDQSDAEGDPI